MTTQLHLGTRKGFFIYEKLPTSGWTLTKQAFLGSPVTITLYDARSNAIFAGLELGHFGVKLHRSLDGGDTWSELPAPAYPPKPDDVDDKNPINGKQTPWVVQKLWSLEAGGEPNQLWCGTVPGGLFESRNNGDSWQLVRSLWDHPARKYWFGGGVDFAGIHSICVDPRDARRIRLAVSCAGVWETRDGGGTWECRGNGLRAAYMPPDQAYNPNVQDPHRLVQSPSDPNHLWIQHHNGIFRSTDDGDSWQELENAKPSGFGFAVAVHPREPRAAWFVPAVKDELRLPVDNRFVVSRTRDGGATFESLSAGLPAPPAFDIVYRHALDISNTTETLAMGSTTGSLWISEDHGDHWQCLSTHLPPIYTVRFSG